MTVARDVQLSMMVGGVPDRVQGWIMPSVFTGSNAQLIDAIAPMYLRGRVLDCTYGQGAWWRRHRPRLFIAHDLATDGVDFRHLPEPAGWFAAVCFDPPHLPKTGAPSPKSTKFRERYGITNRTLTQLLELIGDGLDECCRVVRPGGFVLVKCTDFVANRKLQLGHRFVIERGEARGMIVHDLIIHHSGSGPGGQQILRPVRARRHHSYLVVLRRSRRHKIPNTDQEVTQQ